MQAWVGPLSVSVTICLSLSIIIYKNCEQVLAQKQVFIERSEIMMPLKKLKKHPLLFSSLYVYMCMHFLYINMYEIGVCVSVCLRVCVCVLHFICMTHPKQFHLTNFLCIHRLISSVCFNLLPYQQCK